MRVPTTLMSTVGIAAGAVVGVIAFQANVAVSNASQQTPHPVQRPIVHPTKVITDPCGKHFRLTSGTCVKVVRKERVVVVHQAAAPAPAAPVAPRPVAPAPRPAKAPASGGGGHESAQSDDGDEQETEAPEPEDAPEPGDDGGGDDRLK